MEARRSKFLEWEPPTGSVAATRGEKIGSGKYGIVYMCRGAPHMVVKEVTINKTRSCATSLAFREHAMSLLQTAMVLRSLCPHLPLHYGIRASVPSRGTLHLAYYMEAFDCSLDAAPTNVLVDPKDWIALLFQISTALVSVAMLLEVAHNDLYPRNILLRKRAQVDTDVPPSETTYDIFEEHWYVPGGTWLSLPILASAQAKL